MGTRDLTAFIHQKPNFKLDVPRSCTTVYCCLDTIISKQTSNYQNTTDRSHLGISAHLVTETVHTHFEMLLNMPMHATFFFKEACNTASPVQIENPACQRLDTSKITISILQQGLGRKQSSPEF